mmetsp:Transcript_25733/g.28821  ORF Transcript_25733/g.28821 Transcript_25733/m.28821 type:complete len:178 (+) Transcript_25733:115-648(+)
MSMKLVRKFLQQNENDIVSGDSTSDGLNRTKKLRRRRRVENKEKSVFATDDDVVQATVQHMLLLDQAMSNISNESKNDALKRMNDESKKRKKKRKQSANIVVGNSRTSSSQLRLSSEPTFNKKRHRKELEEKRLKEIAKLLSKNKIKKNKGEQQRVNRIIHPVPLLLVLLLFYNNCL